MLKVKNKKVIFNIAKRHLKRCKARNVIAIIAIALTTLMFTSLFTIMSIMLHSFEQETFRMAGGDFHGTFKHLSWNQIEELKEDSLITNWGARLFLGSPEDIPFNKCHVEVSYMDEICAKGSFCMPTSGTLPKEGSHEIACDTKILNLLGIKEPQIGQKIQISYYLIQDEQKILVEDQFTLSGWW